MLLENRKVSLEVSEGESRAERQRPGIGRLEFFVVSICGATYTVAARTSMEAVNILAETEGLGTDAQDWTLLDDSMFLEIRSIRRIPGVPLNRKQCLLLCGRESGFVDMVEVVAPPS